MTRSKGKVKYLKFTAKASGESGISDIITPSCQMPAPGFIINNGARTVTKIVITIMMLNIMIRYLNFNSITPIIKTYR